MNLEMKTWRTPALATIYDLCGFLNCFVCVFCIVVWLLSCVQGRHEKVRMIARMMIGELLSVGSPRIRHKPRMMLGWCEGGGWMVPGSLG